MCVGMVKQCDGTNEAHIHAQRMLMDHMDNLSSKGFDHPLWDALITRIG